MEDCSKTVFSGPHRPVVHVDSQCCNCSSNLQKLKLDRIPTKVENSTGSLNSSSVIISNLKLLGEGEWEEETDRGRKIGRKGGMEGHWGFLPQETTHAPVNGLKPMYIENTKSIQWIINMK